MYEPLLLIHSWVRWIVLLALIYFFFKSTDGWIKKKPWATSDTHFLWAFNQAFGYQVLFGLTLWLGTSPYTKMGFKEPGLIFENSLVFFWFVRHALTMIIAIGVFQVGYAKSKKAPVDRRYKIISITLAVVLLLIVSAIPWPGLEYGRTLFRGP